MGMIVSGIIVGQLIIRYYPTITPYDHDPLQYTVNKYK